MTKLILSIEDQADKELVLALARRLNLQVEEQKEIVHIEEDSFWSIISQLETNDNYCDIDGAVIKLARCSEQEIKGFSELLAEKLYALDQKKYTGDRVEKGSFSPDTFLDERAYVVSQGKAYYQAVVTDPSQMPRDRICETLLNLPARAWQHKTGKPFEYLPTKNYFTYSNPEGWRNTVLAGLLTK